MRAEMRKAGLAVILLAAFIAGGCCRGGGKVTVRDIRLTPVVADSAHRDAEMTALIVPYKTRLDEKMGRVIGRCAEDMEVAQPESLLGNLIAKMLYEEAAGRTEGVDMAITNVGGIRRTLYAGDITVGDIFEILPFDNALVVLDYKGSDILALADAIAAKGGEATYGISFGMRDGRAVDVRVGGTAVDTARTYRVVTNDYLSFGNDYLEPLARYTASEPLGLFLRDVAIEYVCRRTAEGKSVESELTHDVYEVH